MAVRKFEVFPMMFTPSSVERGIEHQFFSVGFMGKKGYLSNFYQLQLALGHGLDTRHIFERQFNLGNTKTFRTNRMKNRCLG